MAYPWYTALVLIEGQPIVCVYSSQNNQADTEPSLSHGCRRRGAFVSHSLEIYCQVVVLGFLLLHMIRVSFAKQPLPLPPPFLSFSISAYSPTVAGDRLPTRPTNTNRNAPSHPNAPSSLRLLLLRPQHWGAFWAASRPTDFRPRFRSEWVTHGGELCSECSLSLL